MARENYPIEKAGWKYLMVLATVTALCYMSSFRTVSALPLFMFIFTAYFFRNPKRRIPRSQKSILSPADGVVLSISTVQEDRFLGGPAVKVSIFLSILNVHVNRSPVTGEVKYVEYIPGKFFPAFKSHASEINERNYVGIQCEGYRVMVCQITGFIARRIVCYKKAGDFMDQGQLFGMIKFGSCTEIYMPHGVEIMVDPGDRVKGGMTVVGRLLDEDRDFA